MYICLNEEKDTALYYSKTLHRRRKDINKDLRLFEYKTEKNAQKLCDDINSRQNTKFKPVWVERS